MTADITRGGQGEAPRWSLADLDLGRIELDLVRDDRFTYYLVAGASFIETAADLYTNNLVQHFPDPLARDWLAKRWQVEELQHGRALRAYVEAVWPGLDWERGYAGFLGEYSKLCTMDQLESSRALEMAARCVIETGTATFYTTLHRWAREPVLKQLTGLIRRDEVRHYNYFRSFYRAYQAKGRVGRLGILRALYKRFAEAEQEDAYVGFKHAWIMLHAGEPFRDGHFAAFMREVRERLRPHYPYRMAVQMMLQPLELNRVVQKVVEPLLIRGARRLVFA
ncbi:MAG TPA: ferritin-like domain-containing protein [Burkholderiales bacterium]|nr:ferritin-like domain-containing protein [Burkholderiales bacterium]